MRDCHTVDIEGALQAALNEAGVAACAPPVPADLSEMCVVTRTGGFERAYVQDVHVVSIDCYAPDWERAQAVAGEVCGIVRSLPGSTVGTACYASEVTTLPYSNPDPSHPSLARVTVGAQVATRVLHRKEG